MGDQILVVEDSPVLLKVLRHYIRTHLPQVPVFATTYAQARALLEADSERFLVAVLDLSLPDALNGEVVDLVLGYGIPPIVLTANYNDNKREEILDRGAVDYVTKDSRSSYEYVIRLIRRLDRNRNIKALVVDDGMVDRRFVGMLLELQNFQVLVCNDGVQALQTFKENPDIKLVITDANMPNMDGFELITELRRSYDSHSLVIIGLSSTTEKSISARFIKNGANDFLNKPFSHEEFFVRIMQNMEAQEYVERIRHAAERDFLTDLYTRRAFSQKAKEALATATEDSSFVAIIDVDNFKPINDGYGHDQGDKVLQNFAKILLEYESTGVPARLGGEEFVLLLTDMDSVDEVQQLLENFRQAIEQMQVPLEDDRGAIAITVSIGASPVGKDSLRVALSAADKALYEAKHSGKNRLCWAG